LVTFIGLSFLIGADASSVAAGQPSIWQQTVELPQLPTVLVVPLSSQQNALRFGGTTLIQPARNNGLTVPSVALVFQLGACDVRRIGQRLGRLSDDDLMMLRALARRLQGLD